MAESTYYLLIFARGVWRRRQSFDNRERAMAEAMRLANVPQCLGVKVTRETYDEQRGAFFTRTIYRKTKADARGAGLSIAESRIRGILADRRIGR
jgi:hypothetical protein